MASRELIASTGPRRRCERGSCVPTAPRRRVRGHGFERSGGDSHELQWASVASTTARSWALLRSVAPDGQRGAEGREAEAPSWAGPRGHATPSTHGQGAHERATHTVSSTACQSALAYSFSLIPVTRRMASTLPEVALGVPLAAPAWTARGGADRVRGVGLAVTAPVLTVRALDLEHSDRLCAVSARVRPAPRRRCLQSRPCCSGRPVARPRPSGATPAFRVDRPLPSHARRIVSDCGQGTRSDELTVCDCKRGSAEVGGGPSGRRGFHGARDVPGRAHERGCRRFGGAPRSAGWGSE